MNALGYLVLSLLLVLPIAWLFAELKLGRTARITLGIISLIWVGFCVAAFIGVTTTFQYNSWYGNTTKDLVDESVRQLEMGNTNQVLRALINLQTNFQPTYENRARYNFLVSNAVLEMSKPTR
jgi:hypothetical protein